MTGADLEHRTHHANGKDLAVVLDEPEAHFGGPEKMPTAFFKLNFAVRPEGAHHQWRKVPPR
jgi:hypothetical protein